MKFQWGPWNVSLKQHLLVADPVTPGTFYADLVQGGFWKSIDGGATWTQSQTVANGHVPDKPHHGTLAAVPGKSADLWLVDGHEGSDRHGLYHSSDGGASWVRNPAFDYAWELALGRAALGANYPAIYVYGKQTGNSQWDIFQSTDAGVTFNQISYYPYGIIDVPASLAASWDVFGTVSIGFSGNSYYHGSLNTTTTTPGVPVLSANSSNGQITLSWTDASTVGVPTGYNVFRGTSSNAESATAIATAGTLAAYLWDNKYIWKGTVTTTVSRSGTVLLSVPDYFSIASPAAFIRVNLIDASDNILATAENDTVPVQ